jgi:hypothetical protein
MKREPISCTYPHLVGCAVKSQCGNVVVVYASPRFRFALVNRKIVTIETVQPVKSAEPQQSGIVLCDMPDRVMRKSLFIGIMFEFYSLSEHRCAN